jgi:hypothetical protein
MESNQQILNSCFNIMRRLPPKNIKKNIAALGALVDSEDLKEEII